ncbi:hypothetical protein PT276_05965 [Orbaceae bacterium ESL0721]|nr:hypothetical protein [Orbaceae bacterium ESL0721]
MFCSPSYAALSSITSRSIEGAAPYFTFDGGATRATDTSTLLTIKLSNGTVLTRDWNPTSEANPMELPAENQTMADVQMLIPNHAMDIDLNTLLYHPYYYARDDNGDIGLSATGKLSVTIFDVDGNLITNRYAQLESCRGPYKVTLTSTDSMLSTSHGVPNATYYNALSATYYIKPKSWSSIPIVCFAQPSLEFNEVQRPAQGYNWDGPASQWNHDRGFILQDINNPAINFPTMGADGLFFNLSFYNAHSSSIYYEKSPYNSGIGLNISPINASRVNITLTGPASGANRTVADSAVPTTFTIKSGNTALYTFKIQKWFIVKPGAGGGYSAQYCTNVFGPNYKLPNIPDFTNANGSYWKGGLKGQPNNYQRRIGGGLFSEWGNMLNYNAFTNATLDTDFWTIQKRVNGYADVSANYGLIHYTTSNRTNRIACVK